jgi:sulfur relay protein TusB/DsrH
LYLVLHSPFECDCPEHIERFSGNADAGVLLIQDGIYYAVNHERRAALQKRNLKVYALDICMEARGFGDARPHGVEIVNSQRAVDLVMDEYDGVIRM